MNKILLIGTGNVGCHIIELLARDTRQMEFFVADINEEKAALQLNNAVIGAAHHGLRNVRHDARRAGVAQRPFRQMECYQN